MADGGCNHDRVHDIGRARGRAGYAGGAADPLVVRDDVAGFEDPADLVLGARPPTDALVKFISNWFLLRKAHPGEVSVSVWPKMLTDMCAARSIHVQT